MTSKREELDNNKEMNKLLKDNSSKMARSLMSSTITVTERINQITAVT